ncbi:MAG TPA: glycosyltransferase family 4 protein [Symbiobacteriaceae bacterium]
MQKTLPPILLAAMALDLGGAETHVISLARELKRQGHRVVVASAGGRLVPQLTEAGIPHVFVPMASRNPITLMRAYWGLKRVLAAYQIGLVHAHARIPAWIASLAIGHRPIPLVTTYHGTYNAGFPWRYLSRFGQRTIAVSEDVRRHLVEALGAPPDQIRVIPNGFDLNQFRPGLDIAPLLTEFGISAAGPHVVHASRLTDRFADVAMALLEALPEVAKAVPGVRLWILGDGNRAEEVRRRVAQVNKQLGREAAVATGARLDVPRFFNLADCVVAVARTAVEAMACARPVIIAGEGGYRGILLPERMEEWAKSNFTAREGGRPLEPELLTRDLIFLLRPEAASLCREMGKAGRAFVTAHLSIEVVTAKIVGVYREVL